MTAQANTSQGRGIALVSYLIFLVLLPFGDVELCALPAWLTPAKIGFLVLAAGLGCALVRGWRPRHDLPLYAVLGLFVAGAAVAAAFSPDRAKAAVYFVRFASLAVLCVITMWMAADVRNLPYVAGTLIAVAAALALLGIYQTMTGKTIGTLGFYGYFGRLITQSETPDSPGSGVVRASAAFDHPNLFGAFLTSVLPLVFVSVAALRGNRVSRVSAGAAGVLCVAALVFTFSRSAWLGFVTSVVILLVLGRGRWRHISVLTGAGILLAVLLLPADGLRVLLGRVDHVQRYDSVRLYSYRAAVRMFSANPIHGVGPGRFHECYHSYANADEKIRQNPLHHMDAHNMFLDLAAESGVVTLAPFLALLLLAGIRTRAALRRGADSTWTVAVLAGLAAVVFQSLFQSLEYAKTLWILIGLAAGLEISGRMRTEELDR
jgi:hypothetical protein